jgi:ankyrin repeat protein
VFLNGACPSFTLFFPRIIPPDSELAVCIRNGRYGDVKELLAHGEASPADIIGPYGIPALLLAIYYERLDICELLVAIGAQQYAATSQGRVVDVSCFWRGFNLLDCSVHPSVLVKEIVYLLATDQNVEALCDHFTGAMQEEEPLSRLYKAIVGTTMEPLEKVIRESRAYINDTDFRGRTPLHWAVCQGDTTVINRLLLYGANPDVKDRDGKTPLHLAAALGFVDIIATIVAAGTNLEAQECIGSTPIHHASMRGHVSVLELLFNSGADIESLNSFGESPLMLACMANQPRSVDLLCSLGANIERCCNWGYTPIGKALKANGYEAVKILLERGARTEISPYDRKTLLHLVAQSTDAKIMGLLASSNLSRINAEAKDRNGHTARQYLKLRSDGNALLDPFERLTKHAAWEGIVEAYKTSEDAVDDSFEEYYDAVEY